METVASSPASTITASPTPDGCCPVLAATFGAFGTGAGKFQTIDGITTDPHGLVYAVDASSGAGDMQVFDGNGNFLALWGPSAGLNLGNPWILSSDASGRIYVVNSQAYQVWILAGYPSGQLLQTLGSGTPGNGPGQFMQLREVVVDPSGNIFTEENYMGWFRIQEFTSAGVWVRQFGAYGYGAGNSLGGSLVYNPVTHQIGIADRVNGFQWWDAGTGTYAGNWPVSGGLQIQGAATVDPSGNTYVQMNDGTIVEYDVNGHRVCTIVLPAEADQFDGADTAMQLTVDPSGRLFGTFANQAGTRDEIMRFDRCGIPTPSPYPTLVVTATATPSATPLSTSTPTATPTQIATLTATPSVTVEMTPSATGTPACCLNFVSQFASGLTHPSGIAVGPDGTVYVGSQTQGLVYRFAANGTQLTDLGVGSLLSSVAMVVTGGKVYVLDTENGVQRVQFFDAVSLALLGGWSLPAGDTSLGMALGPDGDLYVSGYTSGLIYRYLLDGTPQGSFPTGMTEPTGVSVSGNELVVAGTQGQVGTYQLGGQTLGVVGVGGGHPSPYLQTDMALMTPAGNLLTTGWNYYGVYQHDGNGNFLCAVTQAGALAIGQVTDGMALLADGSLLVADNSTGVIYRFSFCNGGMAASPAATAAGTASLTVASTATPTNTPTLTASPSASPTSGCCLNLAATDGGAPNTPGNIAVAPDGSIYVLQLRDGTGAVPLQQVIHLAADGTNLGVCVSGLSKPTMLAISGGQLFVYDSGTGLINVYNLSNCSLVGSWAAPAAASGLAAGPNGELLIDTGTVVDEYGAVGNLLGTISIPGSYTVAFDGTEIYAVSSNAVYIYDLNGVLQQTIDLVLTYGAPMGAQVIAVAPDGLIYVTGHLFYGAQVYSRAGGLLCQYNVGGNNGIGDQDFGIAIASNGNLLVSNSEVNGTILRFTTCGSTASVTDTTTLSSTLTSTPSITPSNTPSITTTASPSVSPSPSPSPTPIQLACTPISGPGWPMTGHDARQSSIGDAVGPTTYSVRWQVANSGFFAPVVDGSDRVFAGNSTFAAYDAFGNPLWSFGGVNDLGNAHQNWAPIVTGPDQVFLHYNSDALATRLIQGFDAQTGALGPSYPEMSIWESTGPIYQNGAAYFFDWSQTNPQAEEMRLSDGSVPWSVTMDNGQTEGAVASNGDVYMVSTSGHFYSFTPPSTTPNWTVAVPTSSGVSVALDGSGTVYVLLDATLEAFDSAGTLLWSYTPTVVAGPTGLSLHLALSPDGGVYFTYLGHSGDAAYLTKVLPNGTATPTVAWTTQIPGFVWCNSALCPFSRRLVVDAAGTVYVPSANVVAIDASGNVLWSSLNDTIWGMALSHDGTLYVQGGSTLYAIGGDPCVSAVPGAGGIGAARVAVKATATPPSYWQTQLKGPDSVLAVPNPAANRVQVAFRLDQAGRAQLRVMDLTGSSIKTLDLGLQPRGDGLATLDIHDLAWGLYILVLTRDSGAGSGAVAHFKLAVVK